MKSLSILLSLAAMFSLVCTTQAQRPGGERFAMPVQTALDANSDGVISTDEMAQASAALRKLDKNGDGKLTEDEVRPNFDRERREGSGNNSNEELINSLMAFDENKDSKLSKKEVPERMQGIFARADANHDDVLTREELTAAAQNTTNNAPANNERSDHDEQGERREGRGGGRGDMMRFLPLLTALDANSDRVITDDEIKNAPAALKTLDKNSDGQLSEDELRPAFGPGGRGRGGPERERPNGERPPSN
jgi:Ca2+-binding EF-hand superfamily protein